MRCVWGLRRRQAGAHDRIVQPMEGVPTVRPNRRAGRNEGVRDPAQIEWLGASRAGSGRVSGGGTCVIGKSNVFSSLVLHCVG